MSTATTLLIGIGIAVFTAFMSFFFWLLQRRFSDPVERFEQAVSKLEKGFENAISKLELAIDKLFKKSDEEAAIRGALEVRVARLETSHYERTRTRPPEACRPEDKD